MNVHKYLLAVVLGLGICTGNADVWGSKKKRKTYVKLDVTQPYFKIVENDLANNILKYFDNPPLHNAYGNVLAFKCNAQVDNVKEPCITIVLKNNNWLNTEFENQKNVYTISADYLRKLKCNCSKDWCTKKRQDQYAKSPNESYLSHTEYQFDLLKHFVDQGMSIKGMNNGKEHDIKINNVIGDVISLFEPCLTCRADTFVKEGKIDMCFVAIDKDAGMDKQYKLNKCIKWLPGYSDTLFWPYCEKEKILNTLQQNNVSVSERVN